MMGMTGSRYGSRHTKVHTERRERVCEGTRHVSRRSTLFWNTKTTPILYTHQRPMQSTIMSCMPYLALNRRKLLVINGSEKLGRLMYLWLLTSGGRPISSTSSSGSTCCSSLRRFRLALQSLKVLFDKAIAMLTW